VPCAFFVVWCVFSCSALEKVDHSFCVADPNGIFEVHPTFCEIPPLKSSDFRVTFKPDAQDQFFGKQLECHAFYSVRTFATNWWRQLIVTTVTSKRFYSCSVWKTTEWSKRFQFSRLGFWHLTSADTRSLERARLSYLTSQSAASDW